MTSHNKRLAVVLLIALAVVLAAIIRDSQIPRGDLMQSVIAGDTQNVKALLAWNPELVDVPTVHGYTSLHWAAADGSLEIAKALINAGADVNASSEEKVTPLYLAALQGHTEVVKLLIKSGAAVDSRCKYYGESHGGPGPSTNSYEDCTPLYAAAERGHLATVNALLSARANPNAFDSDGVTPFLRAAWCNHHKVVEALLDAGADVNATDENGCTAISFVFDTRMAQILIEHGADPRHREKDGETPLHNCAYAREMDLTRILLKHGADPDALDSEKETPLHEVLHICGCCPNEGRIELVELLLAHGADPNAKDSKGRTPTLLAELGARPEIAALLRTHGGRSNPTGDERIFAAVGSGDIPRTERLLHAHPGFIRARDEERATPLHYAAFAGNLEEAKTLIRHGANPLARDRYEDPPIDEAISHGHTELVKYLMSRISDKKSLAQEMIYTAVGSGDIPMTKLMVSYGADLHKRMKSGRGALEMAVEGATEDDASNLKMVEWLLTQGFSADPAGKAECKPLGYAFMSNLDGIQVARILIRHGATPNIKHPYNAQVGYTLLHQAAQNPISPGTTKFLLDNGADPNALDNGKETPLDLAHDPLAILEILRHGGKPSPPPVVKHPGFLERIQDAVSRLFGHHPTP